MKRLLALALALLMFVSLLSGCGGSAANGSVSSGSSSEASASPAASSATESAATTEAAQAAADEAAKDGVTPKGELPVVKEKITITALVKLLPWISDMVENTYTKRMEERTNIHLDMTVVPQEGYEDKKKLLLTTDDYPEIIMTGAANNNNDIVKYGIEEKIYIPLNPYIEKYSVNLVDRWNELPHIKAGMTAPDGNMYVLPAFEGMVIHTVTMRSWINTAWLEKLGLSMPTTTDEYRAVLEAFKTKDPNGNGKADEVPMSGAINTWNAEPYLFLLNAFGNYQTQLVQLKDGKFTGCANTEGFLEGLKYINGLYRDKLLDPASLTQDLTQLSQLANATPTVLGMYPGGHIGMGVDIANRALADQYDYLLPLSSPNHKGTIPMADKESVNGGDFAITDKCLNPAAAFRMMDLLYEMYEGWTAGRGPQGVVWDMADAGGKGVTGEEAKIKLLPGITYSNSLRNDIWSQAAPIGLNKDSRLLLQVSGDMRDPANYEPRLIQLDKEYQKFASEYEQIMPMWASPEAATELNNQFTLINDYVKASITDFITGRKSFDTDWDSYLAGLKKLGYDEYIAAYEKAYFAK